MSLKLHNLLFAMAIPALLAGCASRAAGTAADSTKTKYVTLPPETGSRVPRRVAVNPDGSLNVAPSEVLKASPEAGAELQRRGNTGGSSSN